MSYGYVYIPLSCLVLTMQEWQGVSAYRRGLCRCSFLTIGLARASERGTGNKYSSHAFFVSTYFVLSRRRVMGITANASMDANILEDTCSSHIGFTSNVLPEVQTPPEEKNSQTGVSTRNVHKQTEHWYALRTTYGREKKAHDFIIAHEGTAFLPTIMVEKVIKGKTKLVKTSRIPNVFFAFGTEESIKSFVYDNVNLPYLRFYYKYTHNGARIEKTPLIVPDNQIRSLQIICSQESANDVLVLSEEIQKFKAGEKVRIIDGAFAGVEGIVARFQGQQRVGIVIDGLLTAVTAYVPSAFLENF